MHAYVGRRSWPGGSSEGDREARLRLVVERAAARLYSRERRLPARGGRAALEKLELLRPGRRAALDDASSWNWGRGRAPEFGRAWERRTPQVKRLEAASGTIEIARSHLAARADRQLAERADQRALRALGAAASACAIASMTVRPNDVDGLLAELDDLLVDDSAKPPPASGFAAGRHATRPTSAAPPHADRRPRRAARRPGRRVAAAEAVAAVRRRRRAGRAGASTNYAAGGADSGYRCSKCDFRVLSFADRAWTADADYMFFRNFVPDCAKLATRLREHEGSTAYACQCNWISADTWAGKLPAQWFGG